MGMQVWTWRRCQRVGMGERRDVMGGWRKEWRGIVGGG